MKTKQTLLIWTIAAVIISVTAFMMAITAAVPVNAQEATTTTTSEEPEAKEVTGTYVYIAQPGDSYSTMARKAAQTYGITSSTKLGPEQVVFAETNLTLEAGSPLLNEGQTVTIDKATVANWVEQAAKLSEEQIAAWQPYTVNVNFNTNNVGE